RVVVGLGHLVGGVEARELLREGAPDREALGALGDHHVGHLRPHARELAVLLAAGVGLEACHRPQGLGEPLAHHADLGGGRRALLEPHVLPLAVGAAPQRADLAHVLAAALGDETRAVDADLDGHLRLVLARVGVPRVALDGVDLARERVEARAVALRDEHLQLVVAGALGDGALDELDLLAREGAGVGGRRLDARWVHDHFLAHLVPPWDGRTSVSRSAWSRAAWWAGSEGSGDDATAARRSPSRLPLFCDDHRASEVSQGPARPRTRGVAWGRRTDDEASNV